MFCKMSTTETRKGRGLCGLYMSLGLCLYVNSYVYNFLSYFI
jgi:hypothetical protein